MIWGATAGFVTAPLIHFLAQRSRFRTVRPHAAGWATLAAGSVTVGAVAVLIRPIAAAAVYAISMAAVLVAAAVDATEQRLPNAPTVGAGVFALAALSTVTTLTGAGNPWIAAASGAIFGCWILLWALTVRGGYGLGDVKLAVTCGILLGWLSWLAVAIGILATQVVIALALGMGRLRRKGRMALGPAFLTGLLAAVLLV